MTFAEADREIRSRFTEALSLINYLRHITPTPPTPTDDLQKSLRGLTLVSIYAAFELAINVIVSAAIESSSRQNIRNIDYIPSMHTILHYSKLKAINDCGGPRLIELSCNLFNSSLSEDIVTGLENPIADKLQNVDGQTIVWVANLFGFNSYNIPRINLGRLGTLRERRNAIAHGRESAGKVGERYDIDELDAVYTAANSETARFLMELESQCLLQGFVRATA